MRDVPGWLDVIDVIVMQLVDELQAEVGLTGDLLEIGAYQGRSAILLQYFCRGGERLSVCDVFESPAFNDENEHEREFFYRDLTRQSFERHFRRIHADLPIIFQCKSHELASRLAGQAFRIIHIDGGHVHEVVRHDVQLAKHLLIEGGAVVIDDYRTDHTPGKFYGSWTLRDQFASRLRQRAEAHPGLATEVQIVCGLDLLRISDPAYGGTSHESYLACQVDASYREQGRLREHVARLEAQLAALGQQVARVNTQIAAVREESERVRSELEDRAIIVAQQRLQIDDSQLLVRLLESALADEIADARRQ